MKISQLSAQSGHSVPTIKYYLREGLLPPGRPTAPHQADYSDAHLHRLRLIRTLLDIGGLSVEGARAVVEAIDDPEVSMHEALGTVHHRVASRSSAIRPAAERDLAEVDTFLASLDWRVKPGAPAKRELADTLASLRELGWDVTTDVFSRYAQAADEIAAWELAQTPRTGSRSRTVEAVVVGTVVFEAALVALRRLAQEHHARSRFGAVQDGGSD